MYTHWDRRLTAIILTLLMLYAGFGPVISAASKFNNQEAFDEAQQLSLRVVELMKSGKYFDAIPLAQKARDILERAYPESLGYAGALKNLAELYRYTEQFEKAEPLYVKSLEVRKKLLDETSHQYGLTMKGLGELYTATDQFDKAEELLPKAVEIVRKAQGETHPNYAFSLVALGIFYTNTKAYQKAEPLFLKAAEIIKNVTGENHTEYVNCLTRLAWFYDAAGNYGDAEQTFLRAIEIGKRIVNESHPYYATLLDPLAGFYKSRGRYKEGEQRYLQASQIFTAALGERSPENAIILSKLAGLYLSVELYNSAETLLRKALEIQIETLGENHPRVITLRLDLASLYARRGQYTQAEKTCQQALDTLATVARTDHLVYARALNILSNIYLDRGKYDRAEPPLQQALEMRRKNLGETNLLYAESLDSLGQFYKLTGRYNKAEPLLARAAEITKSRLGEMHERYANRLRGLADLYRLSGRLKEAEQNYLQAEGIIKTQYGEEHTLYAHVSSDLGLLYAETGRLKEAEAFYLHSMDVTKNRLGEDHQDYASNLNNLATLYLKYKQYDQAESNYLRALQITKNIVGETHPSYATKLGNLSVLYFLTNRGELALRNSADALSVHQQNLDSLLGVSSERSMLAYLNKTNSYFEALVGMAQSLKASNSSAVPTALTWTLRRKGIILDTLIRLRQLQQLVASDREGADLVLRLRSVQQQLSNLALKPSQERQSSTSAGSKQQLRDEAERLEAELTRRLSTRNELTAPATVKIEDVRRKLPLKSVLLEFVRARTYDYASTNIEQRWGPAHYYVFTLSNEAGEPPGMIDMGEAKGIDDAINAMRQSISQFGKSYVADTGRLLDLEAKEKEYKAVAAKLYEMVFEHTDAPRGFTLRQALGGAKNIYLAPDGPLNLLPFEALVGKRNEYLAQDDLRFIYLTGGRDLLRSPAPTNRGTALFGSPNYDMTLAERAKRVTKILTGFDESLDKTRTPGPDHLTFTAPYRGDLSSELAQSSDIEKAQPKGGLRWDRLSDQDVRNVSLQLATDKIYGPVREYVGDDALEEVLKRIPPPGLLHISTHGFFLPIRTGSYATTNLPLDLGNAATAGKALLASSENPLQRSGLVLAGANMLSESDKSAANVDDGWLTAEEIATLNLHGTNLVVLSSCESGLGDVATGEGVYGLRRAFQNAGVGTIILTLFEVTDKDSAELMKAFYQGLTQNKSKLEALHEARLEMIEKARMQHGAAHPYFWASFILAGEPN